MFQQSAQHLILLSSVRISSVNHKKGHNTQPTDRLEFRGWCWGLRWWNIVIHNVWGIYRVGKEASIRSHDDPEHDGPAKHGAAQVAPLNLLQTTMGKTNTCRGSDQALSTRDRQLHETCRRDSHGSRQLNAKSAAWSNTYQSPAKEPKQNEGGRV